MRAKLDKQGRILIPKEAREKYRLLDESEMEILCHEDRIELIPASGETDPATIALKEPCKTGPPSRGRQAFSRERAWMR